VGAGQDADLGRDGPDLVEAARVEPTPVAQDLLPQDLLAEAVVDGVDRRLLLGLVFGNGGRVRVTDLLHARVHLELVRLPHRLVEGGAHRVLDVGDERGVDGLLGDRALGLAHPVAELDLERHDLLDRVVPLGEGLHHRRLADLLRARLHHHDRLGGAGHEQIQLALRLEIGGGRVDDDPVVPVPDAHGPHRVLERDVGDVERGGRADDGERVRVVLEVGREQQADHLRLAGVALGEERPQRPVDHPRGEDLLLVRAALALEEAAGDLAARVVVLAVVHRQGQEVDPDPRLLLRARRGEDDRVAQPHHRGPVGLLRDLARLDREGVVAERQLEFLHHCLGSLAGVIARISWEARSAPRRRARRRKKDGG
jgi:hypothetical protein